MELSPTLVRSFEQSNNVCSLSFSRSGDRFITTDKYDVHFYPLKKLRIKEGLNRGHYDYLTCCQFSPSTPEIFASCGLDKTIQLWKLDKEVDRELFYKNNPFGGDRHRGRVDGLCFSGDGSNLLSVSIDQTVKLWDVPQRYSVHTIQRAHRSHIFCVTYLFSHRDSASGGSNSINIISWSQKKVVRSINIPGHGSRIFSLAIDKNKFFLAYGSDETRYNDGIGFGIIDLRTYKRLDEYNDLFRFSANAGMASHHASVDFHVSGRYLLVSGARDNFGVRLYDLQEKKLHSVLASKWSKTAQFSDDGKMIANGCRIDLNGKSTVMLWNSYGIDPSELEIRDLQERLKFVVCKIVSDEEETIFGKYTKFLNVGLWGKK